ncbi:hypothetical protein HJG60_010445 [Phyllostomus discolor]|uniref:Uncharacterized protein n=1 Tax=Phyllostomus discolor TaxID=89673 RepID=A0A834EB69_9CHIR|nr:hypothetical protein HJG60_010445 [Phyllostomus discolor]
MTTSDEAFFEGKKTHRCFRPGRAAWDRRSPLNSLKAPLGDMRPEEAMETPQTPSPGMRLDPPVGGSAKAWGPGRGTKRQPSPATPGHTKGRAEQGLLRQTALGALGARRVCRGGLQSWARVAGHAQALRGPARRGLCTATRRSHSQAEQSPAAGKAGVWAVKNKGTPETSSHSVPKPCPQDGPALPPPRVCPAWGADAAPPSPSRPDSVGGEAARPLPGTRQLAGALLLFRAQGLSRGTKNVHKAKRQDNGVRGRERRQSTEAGPTASVRTVSHRFKKNDSGNCTDACILSDGNCLKGKYRQRDGNHEKEPAGNARNKKKHMIEVGQVFRWVHRRLASREEYQRA